MASSCIDLEDVGLPHHGVDGAEAQFCHDFAELFCHEREHLDDVFGLSSEELAQFGVLRGDAHRTGVQVAFAHHDAPLCDEGCGGHAPFFSAEQRGDGQVAPRADHAVCLDQNAVAQAAANEGLVRFGDAQFPGHAGVLDGAERRGPRTAVHAGDEHRIGFGLDHAAGNGADAGGRDELDADACTRVGPLQVVDELGEVLDGVDIVVRWR